MNLESFACVVTSKIQNTIKVMLIHIFIREAKTLCPFYENHMYGRCMKLATSKIYTEDEFRNLKNKILLSDIDRYIAATPF